MSRKRKYDSKGIVVSVYLPSTTYSKLDELSRTKLISKSQVIKELIDIGFQTECNLTEDKIKEEANKLLYNSIKIDD